MNLTKIIVMRELVPTEFYLSQNFPNPFKEKTVIKYCLPEEVRIKIEIFDSREKKIRILVDEIKEPGTYQVEFNAMNLSSGVYFYQLRAGDPSTSAGHSLVETKEMILIR